MQRKLTNLIEKKNFHKLLFSKSPMMDLMIF